MWLIGTFAYGAIVICCNMTILYGSFSHTIWSILIIIGSVLSFYVGFFLLSYVHLPTLDRMFEEMISYPVFYINQIFFFFVTFPVDRFLYFIQETQRESVNIIEKKEKAEKKKAFTKGIDLSKLAPVTRCKHCSFIIINSLFRHWFRFLWRCWSYSSNYRETHESYYQTHECSKTPTRH
jgi:hypothetical protein